MIEAVEDVDIAAYYGRIAPDNLNIMEWRRRKGQEVWSKDHTTVSVHACAQTQCPPGLD